MAELAGALDAPQNDLSKILHQRVGAGLLVSGRGPRGGFRLAAAPGAITLVDVVEAVEPGRAGRRCLLGRAECRVDRARVRTGRLAGQPAEPSSVLS